jgi:hypothetical protein
VKGPSVILKFVSEGMRLMETVLLSCVIGAVCTMVLWVAGSAAVMRDQMMRRGGKLSPPEEF